MIGVVDDAEIVMRLTRIPIIESRNVPKDGFIITDTYGSKSIYVRDMWSSIQFPLMIDNMRKDLREHLANVVRASELRLGIV